MKFELSIDKASFRRLMALVGVGCAFFGGSFAVVQAAPIVTTKFTAGDTLTAASLNEHFDTLRDAVNENTPPGTVVAFAGATIPKGWLLCNGAALSRVDYKPLFDAIGVDHGGGDGLGTFNLPDYRGRFLRGVDGNVGRDPDRATRLAPRRATPP